MQRRNGTVPAAVGTNPSVSRLPPTPIKILGRDQRLTPAGDGLPRCARCARFPSRIPARNRFASTAAACAAASQPWYHAALRSACAGEKPGLIDKELLIEHVRCVEAGADELRGKPMTATPQAGMIVRVRQRQYFVEEVVAPAAGDDATLVRMSCLDDDAQGQPLDVLWEKEVDSEPSLPKPGRASRAGDLTRPSSSPPTCTPCSGIA
jgi:hypothetical protein